MRELMPGLYTVDFDQEVQEIRLDMVVFLQACGLEPTRKNCSAVLSAVQELLQKLSGCVAVELADEVPVMCGRIGR